MFVHVKCSLSAVKYVYPSQIHVLSINRCCAALFFIFNRYHSKCYQQYRLLRSRSVQTYLFVKNCLNGIKNRKLHHRVVFHRRHLQRTMSIESMMDRRHEKNVTLISCQHFVLFVDMHRMNITRIKRSSRMTIEQTNKQTKENR